MQSFHKAMFGAIGMDHVISESCYKGNYCSPFTTLCLGSTGVDPVLSELNYKGTILQRNYKKITIFCSPFIKLCLGSIGMDRVISE